ncbi:MAG: hypothetical protein OER04_09755 [Cyclobacteriaceae bacterium]|nr:hypothetical protein [Cyclobacteriaceae bacterium]
MLNLSKTSVLMVFATVMSFTGHAQVAAEASLTYNKLKDNNVLLRAVLTDAQESEPLANIELGFYSIQDTISTSLGKAISNEEGVAVLQGLSFESLLQKQDHTFIIAVEVLDENYQLTSREFTFSDVNMQLSFDEIDSVKQIVVTISTWDELGNLVPLEEADAYLYVPRMFSLLPIGDVYTDEEGQGMLEFPTDLPGDLNGGLEIIAQIEDHDEFGNVAVSESVNWGAPVTYETSKLPRALWSPDAPLWMWITFIVLMVGVWFHYGWVLINLRRIKYHSSDSELINYED